MKTATVLLGAASTVAASNCSISTIKAFLPSNATAFYADHYKAGANFTPPSDLNYGLSALPTIPSTYQIPVDGCVVQANVSLLGNTQYSMGLLLPDEWNGRFLAAGNGAFSGSISWSAIVDAMWYGFAATSTDTGHEGGSAEFAYHNQEALVNWGYRALHDTVVKAKKVVQGYYANKISYSYYRGCSAGGKQGLKEVEMFPDDFDGVVAGAPAWWTTRLQLWNIIVSIWNMPTNASHHISADLFDIIGDEVLKQCGPQDGVVDRIIQDPRGCVFRPSSLVTNSARTRD